MVALKLGSESPSEELSTLPTSTPSKDAAAALDKFDLADSPVKGKLNFKDTAPAETEDVEENASTTATEETEEDLEVLRTRFVGDIHLPESEEPLLKESKRRFVLFPIQYHEVCLFVI